MCVAVSAPTVELLRARALDALGQSPLVELRLDALPAPQAALETLSGLCAEHSDASLLATCRRVAGGGAFQGSVDEQLSLLEACAAAGASLADLELETFEAAKHERLEQFGERLRSSGCALVASAHDFAGPGDPAVTLARLRRAAAPASPAMYKVVNTALRLSDNLPMLQLVHMCAAEDVPMTGMCMGASGLLSRVLALRAGAPFTFGARNTEEATAPGQAPLRTLLDAYRVDTLTGHTRIYGVAGNPVEHSLSPALHNAAFRAAGIDAVYLPLHTTSAADLVRVARELPLHGLSVTMPWKVDIVPLLDSLDPEALAIGAVNTVVRGEDGRLHGANTDAGAVVEPLRARMPLAGARVLLIGAGGAARAAAFGLVRAGAEVSILNRTREAAERLAGACGARVADPHPLKGYAVVVNATPAGMTGPAQAELPVPTDALAGVRIVFEMVYRPVETPLVRRARQMGIAVIDGLEMFVHQGARQFTLWTGQQPPVAAMRAALQNALQDRQDFR